jgi:tRNA(Ile)-lysidine synthetase-like protein
MAPSAIRPGDEKAIAPTDAIQLPARSTPTVRRIVADWRRLTGGPGWGKDAGRRTLVAVSGGADSIGLLLALSAGLARPGDTLVAGHVVHDLRPAAEAHADRDAAAATSQRLGIPFATKSVQVRAVNGNPEGVARRLRYAALGELAREHGCPYIATAHHSGDQLESVLIGLLRGSGPAGLAGVAPKRKLGSSRIIRPALRVSRADLQALCRCCGVGWREDATNADISRLRAALRHDVIPRLEKLRPNAAARAGRSAGLLRDAQRMIEDRAQEILSKAETTALTLRWSRPTLRPERAAVLGALLRLAAARLRGPEGRDRLGSKVLDPIVRAIRSRSTDPKMFPLRGLETEVTAHHVLLRSKDA